ncbi:MAG: hypothetical protein LBE27_06425 [Deltaproteobacteria bacterium]|nr:hypothetical protein [Deltaproteobacteria bacterium]
MFYGITEFDDVKLPPLVNPLKPEHLSFKTTLNPIPDLTSIAGINITDGIPSEFGSPVEVMEGIVEKSAKTSNISYDKMFSKCFDKAVEDEIFVLHDLNVLNFYEELQELFVKFMRRPITSKYIACAKKKYLETTKEPSLPMNTEKAYRSMGELLTHITKLHSMYNRAIDDMQIATISKDFTFNDALRINADAPDSDDHSIYFQMDNTKDTFFEFARKKKLSLLGTFFMMRCIMIQPETL